MRSHPPHVQSSNEALLLLNACRKTPNVGSLQNSCLVPARAKAHFGHQLGENARDKGSLGSLCRDHWVCQDR